MTGGIARDRQDGKHLLIIADRNSLASKSHISLTSTLSKSTANSDLMMTNLDEIVLNGVPMIQLLGDAWSILIDTRLFELALMSHMAITSLSRRPFSLFLEMKNLPNSQTK